MGCTVAELEHRLTAAEYAEWLAFYALDPWGEQRADMRMTQAVAASIAPHSKSKIDPNDYMLFPDAAHDLPDDVDGQEREWMMKLGRLG